MQIWPHSRNNSIWTSEVPAPRTRAPQRIRPRLVLAPHQQRGLHDSRKHQSPIRCCLPTVGGGPRFVGFPRRADTPTAGPVYNSHLLERTNLADRTNLNSNSPPTYYAFFSRTERHTRLGYHTRNRHNVRCRYCAVTYILTHLSSAFILQTASPFPILTKSETLTVLLVLRVSCASDSLAHVQVCCRIVNSCS